MEPIKNAENLHLNTMEPIKQHDKRHLDSIPAGSLGIIPVQGCEQMASEIDYYLTRWRAERESEHKGSVAYIGYKSPSLISVTRALLISLTVIFPVSVPAKAKACFPSLSAEWISISLQML